MSTSAYSQSDLQENRVWAGIGYLLFFVPLLKDRKSKICRFCANQGLLLTIVETVLSILFSIFEDIPLVGWVFGVASGLMRLALFLLGLFLLIQTIWFGRTYELPIIGHIRLIRE